jgi:1-acyl-sn-glycerol-3-phosphate acyltransferase
MGRWYATARTAANAFLDALLVRESDGLERLPRTGGLIVASNHGSFWDPPVLGATLPRELFYLTGAEFFAVPGFGALIRSLNAIPIRRGVADLTGLERVVGLLREGGAVLVFPEGGRMKDGRLHPARPGLGHLVSRARVPVVPVHVAGTNHIRRCMARRERVRVSVGEPLPETLWFPAGAPSTRTGRDLYPQVGDRVMQEIALLRRRQEESTRSGDAPATGTS